MDLKVVYVYLNSKEPAKRFGFAYAKNHDCKRRFSESLFVHVRSRLQTFLKYDYGAKSSSFVDFTKEVASSEASTAV